MVDKARDESMKEQMVVVFRYVDTKGFVKEHFFGLIHIVDTGALTLNKGIYSLLSQHCLDIQNIRGQGYDGASSMRGMWNGLQALILNDCSYAYYIHYFAHRLQLALVKASKQVVPISGFFLKLILVIKIVNATCKHNEQLKVANSNEIACLIDLEELETGSGLNQIGTLQRPAKTWSSHFRSISSLLRMFTPTCEVLLNIIDDASDGEHWAKAESIYDGLNSFEFVFILHIENETIEITDKLCQTLQSQSQDILYAMHLVSSTKALIQKFRDDGWDGLLVIVISFCEKHCIDVLDMNAYYVGRRG
nr:zinc finger MYM-type protein 1-like [Quercus suber]